MARTKLRGLEVAGVQLAIEVPPECDWAWPCPEMAERACVPSAPDLYVGVRVGEIGPIDWDPMTYAYGGGHFHVGRSGEDWAIVLHGQRDGAQRLARFDTDFAMGEVLISPALAAVPRFPLDGPLLELLLLHRIARQGGLAADGAVVLRDGRALAFLGADAAPHRAPHERNGTWCRRTSAPEERSISGRLVFREHFGRAVVDVLPDGSAARGAGVSARLAAIHVVDTAASVSAVRMDHPDAVDAILQGALAPVHDPEAADRLPRAAAWLSHSVPVIRLGMPGGRRAIPFDWSGSNAVNGFGQTTAR